MSTFVVFDQFYEDLGKGVHQLHAAGHTLKAYLTNNAPNASTHAVLADIAGITEQYGYAAADIQNDFSQTGGTGMLTGTDIVWTASGGDFGPFRYAVIYNDTQASPVKPLFGYTDYGSELTILDGYPFVLNFGSSIWTVATA